MSDLLVQAAALEKLLRSEQERTPITVIETVLACAHALIECGEPSRALELLDLARSSVVALTASIAAEAAYARMRALFYAEKYGECERLVESELVEGNLDVQRRLAIRILKGAVLAKLDRTHEAITLLESIRGELLGHPDSVELARCSLNLSLAFLRSGGRQRSRDAALDALVSARRVGANLEAGTALLNLAFVERQNCRWAHAAGFAKEAVEHFARTPNTVRLNDARRALAIAHWKLGRLRVSLESAEWCSQDAAARGNSVQHAYAEVLRGIVLTQLGEYERALGILRGVVPPPDSQTGARATLLRDEFEADVVLANGDIETAAQGYEVAFSRALAIAPRGDIVAELRRRRAECFLLLGKHERARHEAEEAIAHCTEISDRYEEAATYRILALALGALGRHDEARSTFDKGFAAYEDIETPYEWGKLWMSYADWICGEHAGAYRDMNGAHEAYRNAATYFENIGAAGKLEEARKRLAALEAMMQREGAVVDFEGAAKPKPLRRPREIADLRRRGQWIYEQFGMVTRSKIMIDMLEEVARVAASDLPVLILGESGTGKELVAQGVHKLSGRRGRFVPINASALPDTLVEGELFGHTQGAFTNAVRDREGLFEFSNNGTIFLDEIGEMSVDLQAKLLRVLELGEIRRVGGTASVLVDARVVAATNRDRAQMEAGEGFRADLYYRLSHAMFEIPPLRQRGEDVEFLVEHFLDKFCGMYNKRVTISPEAMHRLVSNPWPGNVRQLAATMQRLIVSARTVHTLMPREVPAPSRATPATAPASLEEELLHKERQRIIEALEKSQWVKADAARLLRMSRTTLITKMKRMHIEG